MPAEVETMAYNRRGGVPWHGLGEDVDGLMTAEQAIKRAGLDWEVATEPVYLQGGEPVPGYFGTFRVHDRQPYGIVKGRYTTIQNAEAFDFFDNLVDSKEAKYETAGSLFQGRKIWILASTPKNLEPVRDDVIRPFILLTTSHDGSGSLRALFTPVRVVCNNTLTSALNSAENEIKIKHTASWSQKVERAREVMGFAIKYFGMFEEALKTLAARATTWELQKTYFEKFLPKPETKQLGRIGTWAQEQVMLNHLVENGRGSDLPGVRGTLYGLYQAATEYADHYKQGRGRNLGGREKAERKFDSTFDGNIRGMKDRALKLALSMA